MSRSWFVDATVRPEGVPEIEVEPDGTVELSWVRRNEGDVAALTLLLTPDVFSKIIDRGRDLRTLGRLREVSDALPRE